MLSESDCEENLVLVKTEEGIKDSSKQNSPSQETTFLYSWSTEYAEERKWGVKVPWKNTHVYQLLATSPWNLVHHHHLQVIWTATVLLTHASASVSISFHSLSVLYPPDTHTSHGYLIIRQLFALVTLCSRVRSFWLPCLIEIPSSCVCVCLLLYLTPNTRRD